MVVADTNEAATTVLTSDDGRTWSAEQGPAVSVAAGGSVVGRLGATDVVLGSPLRGPPCECGRNDAAVLARRVGEQWVTTPLDAVLHPAVAAGGAMLVAGAIGPLGIVAVVAVAEGPTLGEPPPGWWWPRSSTS